MNRAGEVTEATKEATKATTDQRAEAVTTKDTAITNRMEATGEDITMTDASKAEDTATTAIPQEMASWEGGKVVTTTKEMMTIDTFTFNLNSLFDIV